MRQLDFAAVTVKAGLLSLATGIACAQSFPAKPVRIVASEAGGGGDFAARLIAQGMTTSLGQQVVVDNRGGGVIAGEFVAKSPPDGYTLLLYGNTLWLLPLMRDHVPYDALRDFVPITLAARAQNILVVHSSLPVKSVKELIALAKAKPGELNYASAVAGAINHLAAELFKSMANVDIVRIPHKGTSSALNSLVGGQVHMMFATSASVTPQIKSGRLRALGVTGAQPSPLFPQLPTISAAGLPGFESVSIHGVFAPAGTPAAVVGRLNQEMVAVLGKPDVKERFANAGVDVAGTTSEQLTAAIKSEMASMGKVIKNAGIRDQ